MASNYGGTEIYSLRRKNIQIAKIDLFCQKNKNKQKEKRGKKKFASLFLSKCKTKNDKFLHFILKKEKMQEKSKKCNL